MYLGRQVTMDMVHLGPQSGEFVRADGDEVFQMPQHLKSQTPGLAGVPSETREGLKEMKCGGISRCVSPTLLRRWFTVVVDYRLA
jgi:hypothetical protein